MVCIADKPGDAHFDVRCYHETFIAVVYRAFQLGSQVSSPKIEEEIKSGKLSTREGTLLAELVPTPKLIARLRESFPDLPENPDPRTVFLKLRELRNAW